MPVGGQAAAHPGDRDDCADGVQADPGAADAVEPATLQHGQAERRAQLQPGAGHHVQPDDQHGYQGHGTGRPERVPPPRAGQRDRSDHRGPDQGQPVLPDRRVRHQPPRHQVGQERSGGHRTRGDAGEPPQRRPAPPPIRVAAPADQSYADEHDQVGRDVDPVEDGVRAHPHLRGGVLPDEPADRGLQRAAASAGDLRAGQPGRAGLAAPAEHGWRQVGEHHHPGLPRRGGAEQAGPVRRAADRDDLQVRRDAGGPGPDDQQRGAAGQFGGDGGELGVGVPHGGGAGAAVAAGPVRERSEIHHGQRAASQRRPADGGDGGQVGADAAGRAGQRQRGTRADGRCAVPAPGGRGQQSPPGAVPEALAVRDQGGHGRDRRRAGDTSLTGPHGHGRQRRTRAVAAVRGLRPVPAVECQPRVGGARVRIHGEGDQRPG